MSATGSQTSGSIVNVAADPPRVLYQARIHPLCPVPALTEHDLSELHRLLREIPLKAIEVNADSSLFPDSWLFRFRWDKGKKKPKGKKIKAEVEGGEEDSKPGVPQFLLLVGAALSSSADPSAGWKARNNSVCHCGWTHQRGSHRAPETAI